MFRNIESGEFKPTWSLPATESAVSHRELDENLVVVQLWEHGDNDGYASVDLPRFIIGTNLFEQKGAASSTFCFFYLNAEKIKQHFLNKIEAIDASFFDISDSSVGKSYKLLKESGAKQLLQPVIFGSRISGPASIEFDLLTLGQLKIFLEKLQSAERERYPETESKAQEYLKNRGIGAEIDDSSLLASLKISLFKACSSGDMSWVEKLNKISQQRRWNWQIWQNQAGINIAEYAIQCRQIQLLRQCLEPGYSLPAEGVNSILHTAINAGIDSFKCVLEFINEPLLNHKGVASYRAIECAVLKGDMEIVRQLLAIYKQPRYQKYPKVNLLLLLAKQKPFLEVHGKMLSFIAKDDMVDINSVGLEIEDIGSIVESGASISQATTALVVAIKYNNLAAVQKILLLGANIYKNSAIDIAEMLKATLIINNLHERENSFYDWMKVVSSKLLDCIDSYIYRDVTEGKAKKEGGFFSFRKPAAEPARRTHANDDEKNQRHLAAKEMLDVQTLLREPAIREALYGYYTQFYQSISQDISSIDLYQNTSIEEKRELVTPLKDLARLSLEKQAEQKSNFKRDAIIFIYRKLDQTIDSWKQIKSTKSTFLETIGEEKSNFLDENSEAFKVQFETTFHEYYAFYLALDSGRVTENDEVTFAATADKLKQAVEVLPNIHLPLPAISGLPLPVSVRLPSAAIMRASVDLYLYMRKHKKDSAARSIRTMFGSSRPLVRAQFIDAVANVLAYRYEDQLKILSPSTQGILYFAEMVVFRIFNYIEKGLDNRQHRPNLMGTAIKKLASNLGMQLQPQSEMVYKLLDEVSLEALSKHEYNWLESEEEKPLMLRMGFDGQANITHQWSSKGILECAGIIDEDQECYGFSAEDVQKYGYLHATREEALERGMRSFGRMHLLPEEYKPWYWCSPRKGRDAGRANFGAYPAKFSEAHQGQPASTVAGSVDESKHSIN